MVNKEQIQQLLGSTVYDNSGSKVGKVGQVYLDGQTDQPSWVTVHTGMFGKKESFVPLHSAQLSPQGLKVPLAKNAIKDAPQIEADQELEPEREAELYRYYHIDPGQGRAPAAAGEQPAQGQSTQRQGRVEQDMAGAPGGGPVMGSQPRDQGGTPAPAGTTAAAAGGAAAGTAPGGMRPQPDAGKAPMPSTAGTRDTEAASRPAGTTDDAMTRSEEQLHMHTEQAESGRARLHKYVVTEQVQTTVPVSHEEVRVEREPITDANRDEAMRGPEMHEADYETTLYAEHPVVEREVTPVERVRLQKETVHGEEPVSEELRKERIEREDSPPRYEEEGRGDEER